MSLLEFLNLSEIVNHATIRLDSEPHLCFFSPFELSWIARKKRYHWLLLNHFWPLQLQVSCSLTIIHHRKILAVAASCVAPYRHYSYQHSTISSTSPHNTFQFTSINTIFLSIQYCNTTCRWNCQSRGLWQWQFHKSKKTSWNTTIWLICVEWPCPNIATDTALLKGQILLLIQMLLVLIGGPDQRAPLPKRVATPV